MTENQTLKLSFFDKDIMYDKVLKNSAGDKYNLEQCGRANKTDERYRIEMDEPIHIESLLCIHVYCNHATLRTMFSQSCRAFHSTDTTIDIIRRHVNSFYWMGRFLKNAIEFWGNADSNITKKIYCPLPSKCVFNQISGIHEADMITTQSYGMAHYFSTTGCHGTVLTLTPKYKATLHEINYLNVASFRNDYEKNSAACAKLWLLSPDTYDVFLLFFQGDTVLSIVDIIIPDKEKKGIVFAKQKKNYKEQMKAILYFERITEQQIGQSYHYNVGKEASLKIQSEYLVPLIKFKMNKIRTRDCVLNMLKEHDNSVSYRKDVEVFWDFLLENEYDTDAIIIDLLNNPVLDSNIFKYLRLLPSVEYPMNTYTKFANWGLYDDYLFNLFSHFCDKRSEINLSCIRDE
eukprot:193446_1